MADLNSIIKKVNKQVKAVRNGERRIIFDSTGEVLGKEPSFSFLKTAEYYIVSNSDNGLFADHSTSSFKIEVFGQDKYINLKILSKVGCFKGGEIVFARHFGYESEHSADQTLNNYIRDWITAFIGQNQNDFIDNFYQKASGDKLLEHIKVEAHDLGIIFQDILYYLEGQEFLKKINVKNDKIETNFRDSTENFSFSLETTLLVKEETKINVISTHKRPADLEKLIYEELREYFPKQVDFEAFASDRLAIENQVKTYLNAVLYQYGREIGAIKIISDLPEAPQTMERDVPVDVVTPEYPETIHVNSKILIRRVDIARYYNNRPENLGEWLEERVKENIASSFFGFKYSEINERFEQLKLNIKNNLKSSVNKIGYELEQIIVIPSFTILESLKKISFHVDDAFITQDQEEVRLKAEIHVAVTNLKKVSHYIDGNSINKIEIDLKELCLNEIKKFIHSVTVDTFHKNFESARIHLETLIGQVMLERFGASLTYLFFDRGEEEVVRKMTELKKLGWTNFNSEVQSVVDYGKIIFSGRFLVESGDLELWQIFRNQGIKIEDLRETIEQALTSELKTRNSKSELGYKTDAQRERIHGDIEKIAVRIVRKNYGINIKISNIDRSEQDWEVKMGIDRRKQILHTIAILHEGLLDATAAGLYDEVKDINKRLNALNKEIRKLQIGESQRKGLTAGSGNSE